MGFGPKTQIAIGGQMTELECMNFGTLASRANYNWLNLVTIEKNWFSNSFNSHIPLIC